MSESTHHDNSINDQSSETESFESFKSFKISMIEKFDKMEKNVSNKFDEIEKYVSNKFNKIMEMFSAIKLIDTEVVARKHDVSPLDNEPSIDEDVNPSNASCNKATNVIEKHHFSSQLFHSLYRYVNVLPLPGISRV